MALHAFSASIRPARAARVELAAVVFLMGAALVFLAGFSHPQSIHDAAHDTRHALSFPCH